jgi:hypothetical protein
MSRKGIAIAIVVVVVTVLIGLGVATDFLVDWAWFSSVGYVAVFWTMFTSKALLFLAVFAVSSLLLWLNGALALRFSSQQSPWLSATGWRSAGRALELFGGAAPLLLRRTLIAAVAAVLGLLIAAGETDNWQEILRFLYQVPYGQPDPLFGKDFSFYLFSLPAYVSLKDWLLFLLVCGAVVAGVVYWIHGDIVLDDHPRRISPNCIAHGSALLGCAFAI